MSAKTKTANTVSDDLAFAEIEDLGGIDLDALSNDRDQLFGEAVRRDRSGERWWPDTDFEREYIKPQQDARFEIDPWDDTIADFLATTDRVRVTDIACNILGMERGKVGTGDQRRIAAVLESKGWKRVRDWKGRAFVAPGYVLPEGPDA